MNKYINFLKEYVNNNYDIKVKDIKVKYEHSFNVYKNSKEFIKDNSFSDSDNKLIKVISLFHDIGRFEQITKYGTMNDFKSIDHGKLGCDILLDNNILNDFTGQEKDIILKSIYYHNKKKISDDLDDRTIFHCRVVRDMDKIDIYRVYFKYYTKNYSNLIIDDEQYDLMVNKEHLDYRKIKNNLDYVLLQISWIYDFNYSFTMKKVLKNKYLDKLFDMIKDDKRKKEIKEKIFLFSESFLS